jgi:hypothetical protein
MIVSHLDVRYAISSLKARATEEVESLILIILRILLSRLYP